MNSKSEQEFSQILADSIEQIRSGRENFQSILLKYPQWADLLRPELELTLSLSYYGVQTHSRPAFISESKQRLMARIQQEAPVSLPVPHRATLKQLFASVFSLSWGPRLSWRIASGLALVFVFVFSVTGTVFASQGALPGEQLYGVKRFTEDVQYTFTTSPEQRAELSMDYANRRLNEAFVLLAHGRADQLSSTLINYEEQVKKTAAMYEQVQTTGSARDLALINQMQTRMDEQNQLLSMLFAKASGANRSQIQHAIEFSNTSMPPVKKINTPAPAINGRDENGLKINPATLPPMVPTKNKGTGSSSSPTSNANSGNLKTPPGQNENVPKSLLTPGRKGVEPGLKASNTPVAPAHPVPPTQEVKPTKIPKEKPPGKDK